MTYYYAERPLAGVISFEVNPREDINAPAKMWTPQDDKWRDMPRLTGADVVWDNDNYEISEDSVPAYQQACRESWIQFVARRQAKEAEPMRVTWHTVTEAGELTGFVSIGRGRSDIERRQGGKCRMDCGSAARLRRSRLATPEVPVLR